MQREGIPLSHLVWRDTRNGAKTLGVAGTQVVAEIWYDFKISRHHWSLTVDRGQTKGISMSLEAAKRDAWAAFQNWVSNAGLMFCDVTKR